MKKLKDTSKNIKPNVQKLPLKEYYSSLSGIRKVPKGSLTPRLLFLITASEATGKSIISVRRWAYGKATPSPLEQAKIAEILKSSPEILFPKE